MTLLVDNRALLLSFRSGDRAALEQVYWYYVGDVERWIRRVIGTRDVDGVAELVQEAFIRAFAPAARVAYDGLRPYRPYLRRIVRNLLVDRVRVGERATLELDDEDEADLDDGAVPPDEAVEQQRIAAATREFLGGLDDESRLFVKLRFEDECSQDDVARLMSCSRRRVRTLEARLRDGLFAHLQRAGLDAALTVPLSDVPPQSR